MPTPHTDPTQTAHALVEALPALIEQAAAAGAALALAAYAMRTALAEAKRVAAETDPPSTDKPSDGSASALEVLRRPARTKAPQ